MFKGLGIFKPILPPGTHSLDEIVCNFWYIKHKEEECLATTLLPSVRVQFGLAWATIYHNCLMDWNLVQGELAFRVPTKRFLF